MTSTEFEIAFKDLTDHPPFPWQWELYQRFARGDFPTSCNLPTGLGKTSVIAIWLLARIHHPDKVPTRLVYVVNRRTVVDQTTTEVEKLRTNLPNLKSKLSKLAISTLRGQFADNRDWSADPSQEAVICGTVDMIGSRLLFSGYGVGFKGKPLHAGFLGQDALLVHDEAHLEPAFQKLLAEIEREQRHGRFPDRWPLRVIELSATSRGTGSELFELTEADGKNATVAQRIHAPKAITFVPVAVEKKQLAEKIVELALVHKDTQRPILIFVRSVEAVTNIVAALRKANQEVQQLTGTLRGLERDRMADPRKPTGCPIFARFLQRPSVNPPESEQWKVTATPGTVYLVCTSAGEVGVNISADHLVCDLSSFESMAQRFGRVNRFGEHTDTKIDIVHPVIFKTDDEIDPPRERTLDVLRTLNGNGSPAALGDLKLELRLAAFSSQPEIVPVSDILFDAWALTTIRDKLPGRPPVADYLHGKSKWEPPQTKVAWRDEVWELCQEFKDDKEHRKFQKYAAELLEDYPLKTHELLGDRTDRVFNALKKLAAPPETPVWVVDEADTVFATTLGNLMERNKDFLDEKTVLLPPQAGGLEKGLLDGTSKFNVDRKDYDVADEWADDRGPLRKRQWKNSARPPLMKREREIRFNDSDNPDADPTRIWYWFVRSSALEADAKSTREYPLQPHMDDARDFAKGIMDRLQLPADLHKVVVLSSQFHDLGKDRKRWQNGIGNTDYPSSQPWAKSGRWGSMIGRSTYRHELGSFLDVRTQREFLDLSPDLQELVLHLIAAHHGRARPHFPVDESLDDNHPGEGTQLLAAEVPPRYARLQRQFGRWGLAYLESLVRASDVLASRKAEGSDR